MPKTIHPAHDYEREVRETVARRLKQVRERSGVTQLQLAEPCDISLQMIQKYEKGLCRISVERLCHFAAILQVPLDDLLGDLNHHALSSPTANDPLIYEIRRLSRKKRLHLKLLLRLWK